MCEQILPDLLLILQMIFTCSDAIKAVSFTNVCHQWVVHKYDGSALAANDFLTKNSSTLKPVEPNVQSRLYHFSSVNECEDACLVSCFSR